MTVRPTGRRVRHQEHENHDRWLVSYADFITLLFAFFTVLYATSQQDLKKQEEFEKSIKKQFFQFVAVTPIGNSGGNAGGSATPGTAVDDRIGKSLMPPPIEGFPPISAGPQEVEDHLAHRLREELKGSSAGEKAIAGLHHDAIGVSIEMASSHLFRSGSAELRPESAATLARVGELLKESGRKIIVEGHTDDLPIHSKEFASNWELSAARATKIVRYLVARHKISPALLVPVAYADQKPVIENVNEENRARNRRIEIKIVTGNSTL